MHFFNFSPSVSCWRVGVAEVANDCEDAMLPVGEDRRTFDELEVELLSDIRGYDKNFFIITLK